MRANLDVDTLLKLILILVVVWLGLSIVSKVVHTFTAILGPASDVIGLIVLVLLLLWIADRI